MNGTRTHEQKAGATRPLPIAAVDGDGRRLDSWKEIAVYLGRSSRCAQRWEKNLGLPVHRIRHVEGYTVYAYSCELDAWRQSRDCTPDALEAGEALGGRSDGREVPSARSSRWGNSMLALCRLFLKAVPARVTRS